nr:MAG TPA: hypothetical protein [Caudoviricetes sp.]
MQFDLFIHHHLVNLIVGACYNYKPLTRFRIYWSLFLIKL